jgi:hypothetical protein
MATGTGTFAFSLESLMSASRSPAARTITRILLWAGLACGIAVNIAFYISVSSPFQNIFYGPLTAPASGAAHVAAAKKLWDLGYSHPATRELVIARDLLGSSGSVLGATSDPTKLLEEWHNIPGQLREQYGYWISVTKQYPEYRDGFLMAGAYAYRLGMTADARVLLQKALGLDPNYPVTLEILEKIGK